MYRVVLLFCSLCSFNCISQKVGFHAGGTLATMFDRNESRMDDEFYNSVLGLDIGMDIKMNITKNVALRTGLSYYQNGFNEDASQRGSTGRIEKNVRLNYIKLPVNFLIQTNEKSNLRIGARAGSYFGYLVGGKFEAIGWFEEIELRDAYQDFDWGLTIGAVASVKEFSIDIGYDFGVQNISNNGTVLISDTVRNRSLNFKFIYYLN